jgi:RND family efflux transporter MFP subunit
MTRRNTYPLALACALFALAGCQKKGAAPAQPAAAVERAPLRVAVITVAAEPFASSVAVTGSLVSLAQVEVKADTTGRVIRFPKEEGDRVAAGEAVAWVDAENYRLGVQQAESAVRVGEAALARARVGAEHNRSELERARNLLQSGGITDRDHKAAVLADQDALAQIAVAEAQIAEARAALEVARKRLADTTILAPVAGTIQRKQARPGAYVEPPTPVFTLVDNARLELESPVPTASLGPIRPGQRVTFSVNAFPERVFEGRVVELNPTVDPQSRSAAVRIQAANLDGRLKAGMFATGEIVTGAAQPVILVPANAVYRDGQSASASVYVAVENKAVRRPVKLGRETGGRLEILEGLQPGDLLIAEQNIELAEGVRIAGGK